LRSTRTGKRSGKRLEGRSRIDAASVGKRVKPLDIKLDHKVYIGNCVSLADPGKPDNGYYDCPRSDLRRSDIPRWRRPFTNDRGKASFSYLVWWVKLQFWKIVLPR